jgi:phosphatidylglycerophosphate synthase
MNNTDKLLYNESLLSGKTHHSIEDPISQLFYDISDQISRPLHENDITPNFVTTVRLIMIVLGFTYFFPKKMYKTTAILYILAYFLDTLDGHMARKYNTDTLFGDYYDHFADFLGFFMSMYYIVRYIDGKNNWVIVMILVAFFLSLIQFGCQERYLGIIRMGKSSSLNNLGLHMFCPVSLIDNDHVDDVMEVTRYVGFGTYALLFTIVIWNFDQLAGQIDIK